MKRKVALFIWLCISNGFAFGQTLTPEPNDTLWIEDVPINIYTTNYIYQLNNSDETIELTWESVLVDVPSGWEYSICDNGICYVGIPAGFTMPNPVPPGESGFLGLNLTPNSEGSGMVQIYVYVEGQHENGFLCTWYFSAGEVGITSTTQENTFSIYPNPAHDVLTIANPVRQNVQYQIRNVTGDLMEVQTSNASFHSLQLNALTVGVYFLQISKDGYTQSVRFIKM